MPREPEEELNVRSMETQRVESYNESDFHTPQFGTAENTPAQSTVLNAAESNRIQVRIHIPQEQYSNINFIALLVGYRGNTLKRIEKESATTVTVLEDADRTGAKGKQEQFYVLVKGDTEDAVKDSVELILKVFETAIKGRGGQEKLTRLQLLEMTKVDPAFVRPICPHCGHVATLNHDIKECKDSHTVPGLILCKVCKSAEHDSSSIGELKRLSFGSI